MAEADTYQRNRNTRPNRRSRLFCSLREETEECTGSSEGNYFLFSGKIHLKSENNLLLCYENLWKGSIILNACAQEIDFIFMLDDHILIDFAVSVGLCHFYSRLFTFQYLDKNGITDLARENFTYSLRVNVGEFLEATVTPPDSSVSIFIHIKFHNGRELINRKKLY